MAAPVVVSSQGNQGTSATPTGALPPDIQVGDLLLAVVLIRNTNTLNQQRFVSGPAGWTTITEVAVSAVTHPRLLLAWKVVAPSEAAPAWTYAASAAWGVRIQHITGADQAGPVVAFTTASGSGDSIALPSIVATAENLLFAATTVLRSGGSASIAQPASMTEIFDTSPATSVSYEAAWEHPPAGATGTRTFTSTAINGNVMRGVMVAIAPVITPSGFAIFAAWYAKAIEGQWSGTPTRRVDFLSDTIKVALTTSAYTPNQDSDTYFSDVINEIVAPGYSAGGAALAGKTLTYDAGTKTYTYDADDMQWLSSTITARYAVIYKDTGDQATSPLIAYVDFGVDRSSSAAAFKIVWDDVGILHAVVVG